VALFLVTDVPIFRKNGLFFRVLRGAPGPPGRENEKKFVLQTADGQRLLEKSGKKAKKNFGGLENGCIFAPAFDRETHPAREGRRGSERTLKSMGKMR